MNKKILFLFSFFIYSVFLCGTAFPQDKPEEMKNPSLFRKKLAEATQLTNTIESTFNQEKSLSVLSEKILTKGKFYFKKNNMLRWEYTEPFKYMIILNNGKILIRDEEKENQFDARTNKVFGEINAILLGCVQGTLLNDEKKFQATFFETNTSFLVKLLPEEMQLKKIFSGIDIYFDKNDYSVSRLIMNEASGDNTTIKFSGKKFNQPIPDEKFRIQ
jgi:outer membrane lipoprotein-sorting protein